MSEIQVFNHPQFGNIRITGSPDAPEFCAMDLCRVLGYDIGEKRLYCWLRDNKYLTLSNMPMQRYSEMGLFFVDEGVHSENGEMASHFTTKVTPKGQQYFINKFIHS